MRLASGQQRARSTNPNWVARRSLTGGGLVRVSVSLAPEVFKAFQDLAQANGTTMAQEIRIAAEIGLEQQDEDA